MHPNQPRFFDAGHCPDCRAPLPSRPASGAELCCPGCGLPLANADADHLASLLTEADRTLATLRLRRQPTVVPGTAGTPEWARAGQPRTAASPPSAAGAFPGYPRLATTPRRELPALSGAAIVLGLGGLCLVVAASIFLSVSWSSLSLSAKLAVLTGVTVLLAAAATAATGRRLRGSAETLWAITFADLGLDLWAARRVNLLGLHATSAGGYTAVAATVVAAVALGTCLATRRWRPGLRPLATPQATLGLSGAVAVLAGSFTLVRADWVALGLAACALVALAVMARAIRLPIAGWSWAGSSLLPWLGLLVTGLAQLAFDRLVPQLWHGRAFELPLAAALALTLAAVPAVLRRTTPRTAAGGVGLAAAGLLIAAIVDHYLPLALALATSTVLLALLTLWRHPVWRPAAAGVLAVNLLGNGLVLLTAGVSGAGASIRPADWLWRSVAGHRLASLADIPVLPALALLGVTAAVLIARAGVLRAPDGVLPWTLSIGTLLATGTVLNGGPTLLVATLLWTGSALITLAVAARFSSAGLLAGPVAGMAFTLACSLAADLTSLIGFAAMATLALIIGRWLPAAVSHSPRRSATELTAVGLAAVAVAAGWHRIQPSGTADLQAGLLAAAIALGIVAALSARRRWWGWLALACLTGWSWVEAAAHEWHAPEPYSVTAGLLMLGLGWRAARRSARTSSWLAFGPALAVLTVPSALLALREPLTWRALAVALVAAAITLAGAHRRLQAPTLLGAAELAALVARELGPYALALPRWVLIGALGLLLLGLGVSWEDRLANLRHTQRTLARMR